MLGKLIEAQMDRLVDIPIQINTVPSETPVISPSVGKVQP